MKNNFVIKYLRDSWNELVKVKWPTRGEIITTTATVVASIVIAVAFTAIIDWGLSRAIEYLVQSKS